MTTSGEDSSSVGPPTVVSPSDQGPGLWKATPQATEPGPVCPSALV